jgi:hypothetical protein
MKKIIIAIIAILLITMVSGCTFPGSKGTQTRSVGQGFPGIEFKEFYPVNKKVPQGSTLTLYYSIQNNGYFDAENVAVTLYNCGDINTGKHSWLSDAENYHCNSATRVPPSGKLMMPNRDQGIAGEISEAEVTLLTNDANLPVGESPHSVSARLEYDYVSTATRDVVFTSFDNWKEKGGLIQTGVLMSSAFPAPLTISINAPSEPIIITESNNKDQVQDFTVSVQTKNEGLGFIKEKSLDMIELCFDSTLVAVSDLKDFEPLENYYCGSIGYKTVITPEKSKLTSNTAFPGFDGCAERLGTSCQELCNGKIAKEVKESDIITGGDIYAVCTCGEADPAADFECLYLFDPAKLKLIGQTNQWRDVSVIFNTKMKGDNAVVQVQDIANFGATARYTYLSDKSTSLTLIGRPE